MSVFDDLMKEDEAQTPYMRARQEWDLRMGSALVHARNWRLASFLSLGIALVAVGGLVFLGAQPKAVPHIIEIDRVGEATYRGPASTAAYAPSDGVVRYHLRRFLEDTRTVSSDPAVLKKNWLEAYAMSSGKGANMLTAFVSQPENDPFRRAERERVGIEVLSMVRVSDDTWQLDWRESRWELDGHTLGAPQLWRAMVRVLHVPPTTADAMAKNPLGLFVDEVHWDRVQT